MTRLLWCAIFVLVACGPSAGGPGDVDGNSTSDSSVGTGGSSLRGTVWMPGYSPDFVAPGYEMPVPGALVYLTINTPDPIPQMAHCEQCVSAPGTSAIADPKGNFILSGVLPGDYLLVVQKGQFRLEQPVTVPDGVLELPASSTTLPNTHDPDNGRWIPKMALATGLYDSLENIFGKLQIAGTVDGSGNYVSSADAGSPSSQLHFYSNGGRTDLQMSGSLASLVSDLDKMMQYHIIFIPCSTEENNSALRNQDNQRNIRDYVAAGGKFYAADWSGEWVDNVFPAQMRLQLGDTPASAYDPSADTWNTAQFGYANGSDYESHNAEAVDETLYAWLDQQLSPQPFNQPDGLIDGDSFGIDDIWTLIVELTSVQVGVDSEGIPVFDAPKRIVIGGEDSNLPKRPLTVSFQPAGCGRVMFSGFHTAHGLSDPGLLPQERILTYLIMEIGECVDNPIID